MTTNLLSNGHGHPLLSMALFLRVLGKKRLRNPLRRNHGMLLRKWIHMLKKASLRALCHK
jgi:hypothetical protein